MPWACLFFFFFCLLEIRKIFNKIWEVGEQRSFLDSNIEVTSITMKLF